MSHESPTGGPRSFTTRAMEDLRLLATQAALGPVGDTAARLIELDTAEEMTDALHRGAARTAEALLRVIGWHVERGTAEGIAQLLRQQSRECVPDSERAHALRVAAEFARTYPQNRTAESYAGEIAGERIARLCPPEEQRWPAPPKRPGWQR